MIFLNLYAKAGVDGKYRKKDGPLKFETREKAMAVIENLFKDIYEKSMATMGLVDVEKTMDENEAILVVKPVLIFYKNVYYRFTIKEV